MEGQFRHLLGFPKSDSGTVRTQGAAAANTNKVVGAAAGPRARAARGEGRPCSPAVRHEAKRSARLSATTIGRRKVTRQARAS
jgi:hypothetical protein